MNRGGGIKRVREVEYEATSYFNTFEPKYQSDLTKK